MEKYWFNDELKLPLNVACIGYFDGVHRGHQELLKQALKIAKEKQIKAYVITFDPYPLEVIKKQKLKHLTTLERKCQLLERFGMDGVVIVHFDEKLMRLSADEFKKQILDQLNIDTLICGFDFTYGYLGKGNIETLKEHKVKLITVPEYQYYGKKISSTRIRKALEEGNYKLANAMLGYEYQ